MGSRTPQDSKKAPSERPKKASSSLQVAASDSQAVRDIYAQRPAAAATPASQNETLVRVGSNFTSIAHQYPMELVL